MIFPKIDGVFPKIDGVFPKFWYVVFFTFNRHDRHEVLGFGVVEVSMHAPIRGMADVKEINESIEKGTGCEGVMLTGWKWMPFGRWFR